jgi:undecaprenyl-diphosphatase
MFESILSIDKQLLLFLNGCHSPFWDSVMWIISNKYTWLPLYVCLIAYFFYRYKSKGWVIILTCIVLIALSDQLSSGLMKPLVHRLRPTHDPSIQNLVHIVRGYKGGTFGFASSHAANVFALATFIYLFFRNKAIGLGLFLWAAIVAYSRIYLGVHFPGDVLAGACIGLFSAFLVYLLLLKADKYYNWSITKQPE